MANLALPMNFGNFNSFRATLIIPEQNIALGTQIFPTPEDPPTYSATIDFPTAAQITPNSRVVIQPYNAVLGIIGPIVLEGSLMQCHS